MQYTISLETLRAVKRARAIQTKAARKSFAEHLATVSSPWDKRKVRAEYEAATISRLANLHLVNGKTIACAVDVGRLVDWAKAANAKQVDMRIEEGKPVEYTSYIPYRCTLTKTETRIALITERQPGVRSSVFFNTFSEINCGKHTRPAADLGAPLRLVAPAEGGEFVFEGGAV